MGLCSPVPCVEWDAGRWELRGCCVWQAECGGGRELTCQELSYFLPPGLVFFILKILTARAETLSGANTSVCLGIFCVCLGAGWAWAPLSVSCAPASMGHSLGAWQAQEECGTSLM